MGVTDYGTQTISFNYKEPGRSEVFNKLNYKLIQRGIYEGGFLSYVNATTVQLSPLVSFIEDNTNEISIRLETELVVDITVSVSTPYIVARFVWDNVSNNYADIIAVAYGSILSDDVIIGRCAYDSGNVLQTTFDYTRRTISLVPTLDDKKDNLKTIPLELPSNVVFVSAGDVLVLNNPFTFTGGNTSVIPDTVDGRIDIVYIDDFGVLQVLEGTDAVSPIQPDFPSRGHALSKITRGALETVIRGDQIEQFDFDGVSGGASTAAAGGSSIEATTGESIDAGELVYFSSDGKLYLADNRDFEKSIVAGFALETAGPDTLITVGKLGLIEEFTGLTAGVERYLGYDGLMIPLGSLNITEYKVHVGTCVDTTTIDAFVQLPELTINQDGGVPISALISFPKYKDRSGQGYLPFTHDSFSQANYFNLFSEIGHVYNDMHVEAGGADLSASGTLFYATPIPGYYERGGTQDTAVINSTDDVDDSTELITLITDDYNALHMTRGVLGTDADGVPVRLKLISGALPTGLVVDTTYFINFGTTPDISLHATEADAIADTSPIDLTDAVGTFKITQEGIALDDAGQRLTGTANLMGSDYSTFRPGGIATGVFVKGSSRTNSVGAASGSGGTDMGFDSANSPDARTSNETRPKTFISFGYIKAEHITTAGQPISALRYDTGWLLNELGGSGVGDWVDVDLGDDPTQNSNISHGLSGALPSLSVRVFVSETGNDSDSFEIKDMASTSSTAGRTYGWTPLNIDDDTIVIKTASYGIYYVNSSGTPSILQGDDWYYKVVITKPNLVATYADTSFRKVYDISDATDYTFTLPDASTQLTEYIIKRRGSGAGKVTVTPTGAQKIYLEDQELSTLVMVGTSTLELIPYGGDWEVKSFKGTIVIDWSSTSTWTAGASITINHDMGVEFDKYIGQIFVRDDTVPDKIYNVTNLDFLSSTMYGQRLNGIDGDLNSCYLQIYETSADYISDAGGVIAIPTSGWSYKVVLKFNF